MTQLAVAGLVKIYLSEVSKQEWASQITEAAKRQLDGCLGAINDLRRAPIEHSQDIQDTIKVATKRLSEGQKGLDDSVKARIDMLCGAMHAEVLRVDNSHGGRVMERYFAGGPPFKLAKSRDDFPDAFIYAAIEDLCQASDKELFVVTNDKNLAVELPKLNKVEVFSDLKAFVQSPKVAEKQATMNFEVQWNNKFSLFRQQLSSFEADIAAEVSSQVESAIAYKTIHADFIPDDNSEAIITMTNPLENIDFEWDSAENLGAGWISIDYVGTCEVLADFYVYRSDAYHQPNWVHVSYRDPDEHYYFEAQADFTIEVSGTVSVYFEEDDISNGELAPPAKIEIEKELAIHVKHPDGEFH